MGANATNALLYLIKTLFNLYMSAVLLRIVLQWVRADFFNPISQLVWKVTQPPLAPFKNLIPRWRRLDTAAALLLFVLSFVFVQVVIGIFGFSAGILEAIWYALLKIVLLGIWLYTITLFGQAILSWLGPGVNNPAANVLWSINEPLLRPVRRVLPAISNLDLSPLFVLLALQVLARLVPLPGVFA